MTIERTSDDLKVAPLVAFHGAMRLFTNYRQTRRPRPGLLDRDKSLETIHLMDSIDKCSTFAYRSLHPHLVPTVYPDTDTDLAASSEER